MDDIVPPNNSIFKVQKFRIIEPLPIQRLEDIIKPENMYVPINIQNLTTFNRRQEPIEEEQTQVEIPASTPENSEYSEDENDQLNVNLNPNMEINLNLDLENRIDNQNHDEQLTIQSLSDTKRKDDTTLNVVVEQDTKVDTGFKTITLPESERYPCLKTGVPDKDIKEVVEIGIDDDDQDLFSNSEEDNDKINQNDNPIMKILKSKNSKEKMKKEKNMNVQIYENMINISDNQQNMKLQAAETKDGDEPIQFNQINQDKKEQENENSKDEVNQLNLNLIIRTNSNSNSENRMDNQSLNDKKINQEQSLSDTKRTDEKNLNKVVEQYTKADSGFKTKTLPETERLPCLKT
jgi:hypothetical protein